MSAQNFSSFVSTDKTVDAEGPTVPNTPTAKYSIRLDNGIVSGNPSATEEVVRCDVAIPVGRVVFS